MPLCLWCGEGCRSQTRKWRDCGCTALTPLVKRGQASPQVLTVPPATRHTHTHTPVHIHGVRCTNGQVVQQAEAVTACVATHQQTGRHRERQKRGQDKGGKAPRVSCVCCLCAHQTLSPPPQTHAPVRSFLLGTTPRGPEWCPGGRTAQNALDAAPLTTRSTARHTDAAARSATWWFGSEGVE